MQWLKEKKTLLVSFISQMEDLFNLDVTLGFLYNKVCIIPVFIKV